MRTNITSIVLLAAAIASVDVLGATINIFEEDLDINMKRQEILLTALAIIS